MKTFQKAKALYIIQTKLLAAIQNLCGVKVHTKSVWPFSSEDTSQEEKVLLKFSFVWILWGFWNMNWQKLKNRIFCIISVIFKRNWSKLLLLKTFHSCRIKIYFCSNEIKYRTRVEIKFMDFRITSLILYLKCLLDLNCG